MTGRVTAYVYGVVLLGIVVAIRSLAVASSGAWMCAGNTLGTLVAFAVPVVLTGVADVLPVRLATDTKVSVSAAVAMAVLLTYPASEAIAVVGLAILLANLVLRREPLNVLFNVGQHLIVAAVVGSIVRGLDLVAIDWLGVIALLAAGATFVLLNSLLVAGVVAVHQGHDFHGQLASIARLCWAQYGCLVLIGMLGAALFRILPVATPLVFVPLVLVHRSYADQALLRSQTRETLEFLADVIDSRDPYTFQHSQRVAKIAGQIAATMGLSEAERELVVLAARVHDIGKIGTDAEVLMKRGPLSSDEMAEIRKHPVTGAGIVGKLSHLRSIRDIVLFHHKRYDCTGYPEDERPAGGRLPLGAAIVAVADAFDAMTTDRPYRTALPLGTAVQELRANTGTQFSPDVVRAFVDGVLHKESGQQSVAPDLVPRFQEQA